MHVHHFVANKKGLLIGAFSMAIFGIARQFPEATHMIYREGIFQVIRIMWDHSLGVLSFPLIYVLLPLWVFWLYIFYKKPLHRKWISLANGLGWMIATFLWLWGLNYAAQPLIPKNTRITPNAEELYQFGSAVAEELNSLSIHEEKHQNVPIADISLCVKNYLQRCGWNTNGKAHCVELGGTFLRRLGIAGIYLPYSMQGHCDATYPASVKNMIKAHELSHAYGITDEGEADFVALAALLRSAEFTTTQHAATLRYAALLELTRSIRSELHAMNDSLRIALDKQLSTDVLTDIIYIKINNTLYPPYFPKAQSQINHVYLKTMGVREGIKSYDLFCGLAYQQWLSGELELSAQGR